MATRTSPELPKARFVLLLAHGVEVVLITSATVEGKQRVVRNLSLLVAHVMASKSRHSKYSRLRLIRPYKREKDEPRGTVSTAKQSEAL
eukprot:5579549-Alexandrium_andersonii.AAC.1